MEFYNWLTFSVYSVTLQQLCELKSQTINSIKLLMVGSIDIKSFSTGQALQNSVYGQHMFLE